MKFTVRFTLIKLVGAVMKHPESRESREQRTRLEHNTDKHKEVDEARTRRELFSVVSFIEGGGFLFSFLFFFYFFVTKFFHVLFYLEN